MKIMTILGTRPEIIRLSLIIPILDRLCEHVVIHTGQNYNDRLNDIFFDELELRKPDYIFECKSESFSGQIAKILTECEKALIQEKPDRVLVLGDTNSGLSAIVAKRMNIPVYHMEAGNRCYDDRVPEEVNRRIIDHCSDILMPYTERSRTNLHLEGISNNRIYVIGNPILEVIENYKHKIDNSRILEKLNIKSNNYFLVTLHRAENVDLEQRLDNFIKALHKIAGEFDASIICSIHPRTKSKLNKYNKQMKSKNVIEVEPLGFFDFICLEKNALCVLSDSGTVQEECCIFKIPNVTLRDVTERPETIEAGSNIITGNDIESILSSVKTVLSKPQNWTIPPEYLVRNVSGTVVNILMSHFD